MPLMVDCRCGHRFQRNVEHLDEPATCPSCGFTTIETEPESSASPIRSSPVGAAFAFVVALACMLFIILGLLPNILMSIAARGLGGSCLGQLLAMTVLLIIAAAVVRPFTTRK